MKRNNKKKELEDLARTLLEENKDTSPADENEKEKENEKEREKLIKQLERSYHDLELSPTKIQEALLNVESLGTEQKVIDALVSVGYVPRLVKFLDKPLDSMILDHSLSILSDVSSVGSYSATIAQQSSALDKLIMLLKRFTEAVEQKLNYSSRALDSLIVCMGNIISENTAWRNFMVQHHCLNYLTRLINNQLKLRSSYKSLKTYDFSPPLVWCISECLYGSPYPNWNFISGIIPTLITILDHKIVTEFLEVRQKAEMKTDKKDDETLTKKTVPELMEDLLDSVIISSKAIFRAAYYYDEMKNAKLVDKYGKQANFPYNHLKEVVNTDLLMALMKLINSEFAQNNLLDIIDQISECENITVGAAVFTIPNFLNQFRHAFFYNKDIGRVRHAIFILSNLAITTLDNQFQIIQESSLGPFLSYYLSKTPNDEKQEKQNKEVQLIQNDLVHFLDTLVLYATEKTFKFMIINWNLIPIICHYLTIMIQEKEATATVLLMLRVVYRLLYLDSLFSENKEIKGSFEKNGLLPSLDSLQYHLNEEIYEYTVGILVYFFNATADFEYTMPGDE